MRDRFVKDMNRTCRDTIKNRLYAYASELVSLLNDYDKRLANQITISNWYCEENHKLRKELEGNYRLRNSEVDGTDYMVFERGDGHCLIVYSIDVLDEEDVDMEEVRAGFYE